MVKKNYDNMLSRFHMIPERQGRTDGRTGRIAISISRVIVLTRDIKLAIIDEYLVDHCWVVTRHHLDGLL